MDNITIIVTPDQRRIILQALHFLAAEAKDSNRYDYDEVEAIRTLVSNTKCGDRYCTYCGDLKYEDEQ